MLWNIFKRKPKDRCIVSFETKDGTPLFYTGTILEEHDDMVIVEWDDFTLECSGKYRTFKSSYIYKRWKE